ncbi:MAG: hypothetical protein ACO1OQ_11090 [Rufibacter sp.]
MTRLQFLWYAERVLLLQIYGSSLKKSSCGFSVFGLFSGKQAENGGDEVLIALSLANGIFMDNNMPKRFDVLIVLVGGQVDEAT